MLLSALSENLLILLNHDRERAPIIRGTVDVALFGGIYRDVASRIYDHLDRFKKPPGDHLPDILADKLDDTKNARSAQMYRDVVEGIHAAKDGVNSEYVMSQLDTFVRRQSLRSVAVELAKELQRDTEASLEKAEILIAGAGKQSLSVFDPGTRLSDKKRALHFLDSTVAAFPTGIPELDKRGFGPTRKELWLYIANTKAGKCIAEGEPVLLADGSYIPVEQVVGAPLVPALNENSMLFENKAAVLSTNGVKPVFKVRTRTGRQVILTGNHPLLTKQGWLPVNKLKVGQSIAAPYTLPVFGNNVFFKPALRILGYLIADGGLTKSATPTFTKHDDEVAAAFDADVRTLNCKLTPSKKNKGEYWVTGLGKGNAVTSYLRIWGLIGKKSNAKTIPAFVFKLKKEYLVEFLRALFSCDGSVYDGDTGASFEYSTTSPMLARQIDHLFTRFGLVAKTRERWQQVAGKPYVSWSLIITGKKQIVDFQSKIGLSFVKGRRLEELVRKHGLLRMRQNYTCNDRSGDIFYDRITAIEPLGKQKTYDLSVKQHHNFIAGNVIVHNTWKLIQLAKMALLHRLRVVHITLEMSEDRSAQRYYQSLFGIAKRKEMVPITKFELDDLGRISGFDTKKIMPKLTLDDPKIRRKLERKIDDWGSRILDNIIIKQFPTGSLTLGQLVAFLDNLELTERFVPDLLVLDYPDLMKLDADNYRLAIDALFKGLRGVAVARNVALAVVSQSHRSAAKAKQVGADNVAEAYSKIAHADTIITYSQTDNEKALGLARLHVAGGRNDQDRITVVISQQYAIGGFVIDSSLMRGSYWANVPNAEDVDNEDKPDRSAGA